MFANTMATRSDKGRPASPVNDVTVRRKAPETRETSPPGCTLYVGSGAVTDQGKNHALTSGSAIIGRGEDCAIRLADSNVSRHHAELKIVPEGILVRDLGSTNGIEHQGRRMERAVLQLGARIVVGCSVIDLLPLTESSLVPLSKRRSYGDLVGGSAPMRRVFSILESLEHSNAPVLIQGETGTGKELTAQALYEHSDRAKKPFVIIDCSNIPRALMESELFGHAKGAFTGATANRKGAFETADKGTVFLDEVDDLPLGLQPKLLRALESGQIRRLGETAFRSINTRVIATTKHDLVEAIGQNHFRSDLYYRLAVVKIRLPPLRERIEDIPALAQCLMERIGGRTASRLSPQAEEYLMRHRWPGNVRQLRNALERMLALRMESTSNASELSLHLDITREVVLPTHLDGQPGDRDLPEHDGALEHDEDLELDGDLAPFRDARRAALETFERKYLSRLMARSANNLSGAARLAGIDRKYLRDLLKKHDLYEG